MRDDELRGVGDDVRHAIEGAGWDSVRQVEISHVERERKLRYDPLDICVQFSSGSVRLMSRDGRRQVHIATTIPAKTIRDILATWLEV